MFKHQNVSKKRRMQQCILALLAGAIVIIIGLFLYAKPAPLNKVQASSVVSNGDFRLTAENSWDNTAKRSYVDLKWDKINNLTQSGYKLYQSEDGSSWSTRSMTYGKSIKVLNVYPDIAGSNTLKGWMDGLNLKAEDGSNLIQVTAVSISDFNTNPDTYLKGGSADYQQDVIMFGSWDSNNEKDISEAAAQATVKFLDSGRGVLFGHDTVYKAPYVNAKQNWWKYFHDQKDYLGIGHESKTEFTDGNAGLVNSKYWTGSQKVKIINDGYLMKYPFELANELVLNIPYSHNIEFANKNIGTTWAEFIEPSGNFPNPIYDEGDWRGGWYLKTNDSVAMIQTGHSGGQSTQDERKIIANVLYNLAQVSSESNATDYSVTDDQGPEKPKTHVNVYDGKDLTFQIEAADKGKDYQFYVEADTKDQGVLKSDVVKETVASNVAGYFFEFSDSPTSTLTARVEGLKDEFGRIDPAKYDLYVAPDTKTVDYNTAGNKTISAEHAVGKYLHVVAVDRANNIGEIASQKVKDTPKLLGFEIERTADEAKIVELSLNAANIGNRMKSIEIQIPKNTEIKDYAALQLPSGWYSFKNSETTDYYSFSFAMGSNNSVAVIEKFLTDLRFTIKDPVNDPGNITIFLHEKIYTSWVDGNGVTHYYVFMPEMTAPGKNWFEAYNSAKTLRYRGLTGYLATITSAEEHDFIFNNIAKEPGLLGGTRGVLKNGTKINDEAIIPQNASDYDIEQDNWYWANGPEAGEVFYVGKTRNGGYTPAGAYSLWGTPSEPNNTWIEGSQKEYILQFAKRGSKNWNDLPGTLSYRSIWNHGYYVEFSEYGDQKEGVEETDVAWSAAIPQKISLKAYEEQGAAIPYGDLLYDQQLRIEQTITVQPKTIDLYEFLEVQDTSNTPRSLTYQVLASYQEGKLIYTFRGAKLHVRQVILEDHSEIPVPKEGYLTLKNRKYNNNNPELDASYQNNRIISSGRQADNPSFTDVIFSTKHQKDERDETVLDITVPAYYHYEGYHVTTQEQDPNGASHQGNSSLTPGIPAMSQASLSTDQELWLTLYLRPSKGADSSPELYSWDYEVNKFNKINQ
ncbi:hypothetical protein [Enterococcus sp. AZ163]|uniref:hypothetical protein n=1 Tax=Enterococcus sp. AZ163 TaxID=2774638 RepID=UPI003D2DB6BA